MRIGLYFIIILTTGLACLTLLVLGAAGASSHNVPVGTFRFIQAIFIGLVLVDIFAIYRLRKINKRTKEEEFE